MQKGGLQKTTPFQWGVLMVTAAAVIGLDQIAKGLVVAHLELYEVWLPIPAFRDFFEITYTNNTGAAFGIFQSAGTLFTIIAIVASGVIIYYYRQITGRAFLLRIALGLQLGGALGNVIDRIARGFVVDFLHVFYEPIGFDWPVFNFADSAIVVGVLLLLLMLGGKSEEKKPEEGAVMGE